MTLYDLIYDFITNNLLSTSLDLPTETIAYNTQLANILTHVSIVLIFAFLVMLIIWLFKLVGGLFKW